MSLTHTKSSEYGILQPGLIKQNYNSDILYYSSSFTPNILGISISYTNLIVLNLNPYIPLIY